MAKHLSPQQGSPWARVLVPWLAGAAGGGPNGPLSADSEIKLSVTAAAADCIVDAVLGDLTIAQCKLVSCQRLQDGDVGWGSGLRSTVQAPANTVTGICCLGSRTIPTQVILSRCGHSGINSLSVVWEPLPGGECRGEARHQLLVPRGRRGAAVPGLAAG